MLRADQALDGLPLPVDKERMEYDVRVAEAQLAKLLANAQTGEDVVITEAGKPIARIVAIRSRRTRQSGTEQGKFWFADDFNAPLPRALLDSFEGRA